MRDLGTRSVMRDFNSSGRSSAVTQVVIDGVVFANAAEWCSWDDTCVQVHVCEECGTEHCASGGWLVPRNVGVGVAFVPAFDDMLAGRWEQEEYAPPYFARGMPVFVSDDYVRLGRWIYGLPPIEAVPVLTGGELLRCMQWDAPARVLGVFPADIQLERDLLLAASEGEVSDAAAMLEKAIRQTSGESRVWLTPSSPTARAVTLYLDTPGTPGWTPLCIIDDHVRLAPLPGHLVDRGPIHRS